MPAIPVVTDFLNHGRQRNVFTAIGRSFARCKTW
jgi:hypothetical protein